MMFTRGEEYKGQGPKNNVIGVTCSSNNDSGNATYTQSDQNKGDATASVNVSTTDNERTTDQDVAMTKNPIQLANVPNDVDYDVWLPLDSVYEEKYGLKKVTLVKGFFFFKFSSTEGVDLVLRDGPWMIHGVLIFLNKWSSSVSLLKEDLSRVLVWVRFHDVPLERCSYVRILIEIKVCNDFSDNLVMDVPKFKGTKYTKEIIRVEYEWKPPRCSTCLIFGLSLDDCQKAPKQVVNKMDKGKGGSSGADDEGFVEVKKKKSGAEGANQKTTPSVGKKNASTSGNGTFSFSNSFEALNVENSVSEEIEMGNKASTSGVQEEGPLKNVEYSCDQNSEDETESVDNEMTNYLASKPTGVGCDTKSLLEQWRETYVNDDYDPYDDDMYESQDIPDNIQSMCDNLDIKQLELVYRRDRDTSAVVEGFKDAIHNMENEQNVESGGDNVGGFHFCLSDDEERFNANFRTMTNVVANAMTYDNNRKAKSEQLKDLLDELMKLDISSGDVLHAAEISASNKDKLD
nr:hypothetical protein [Tanacetum cinerariifolium]